MQRLLPFALLLGIGTSTLSGCATYGYGYGPHHHYGGGSAFGFVAGALVGAAIASSHDEAPPPEPAVITRVVYVNAPPPPPPPPVTGPLPPRERYETTDATPPFDVGAARHAMNDVDLAECKEHGAPQGYGHAKITFAADGSVKHVLIDGPAGLAPDAVACIGKKLGEAHVSAFRGSDVTAGFVYRVE